MLLNCYVDEYGSRRAETPPGLEVLGRFLEEDVQGSLESCDLLLKDLTDVERGARPPIAATGNAHHVVVEPDVITIENIWDDSLTPIKLTPMQYRQAISEWYAFLRVNQPLYTFEQYLEMERKAEFKNDFISGRISLRKGTSRWHNVIMGNTVHMLSQCLRQSASETYPSDMKVLIGTAGSCVYPDATVTGDSPQFLDRNNDVLLNPQVIVEVLSESTEAYDRGGKFVLYQGLESLQEYVLVSQDKPRVERYVRQSDGQWLYSRVDGLEAEVALEALGISLPLAEIYERVSFPQEELGITASGEHTT